MKCYNHNTVDAVGICKACNKGICTTCATDVGNGIACSQICADEVEEVNALIEKNIETYANSPKSQISNGFFYAGLGLILLLLNVYFNKNDWFFFMFSFFIMAMGLYMAFMVTSKKNK